MRGKTLPVDMSITIPLSMPLNESIFTMNFTLFNDRVCSKTLLACAQP